MIQYKTGIGCVYKSFTSQNTTYKQFDTKTANIEDLIRIHNKN